MKQIGILDTGPLVALLNGQDSWHDWCVEQIKQFKSPILTCEPVITESLFLLHRHAPRAIGSLFNLLEQGLITIPFVFEQEAFAVRQLMERYSNVPASLADACLLRMAERLSGAIVFTLDSDFLIYRIHRNQPVPCLHPEF